MAEKALVVVESPAKARTIKMAATMAKTPSHVDTLVAIGIIKKPMCIPGPNLKCSSKSL